MDDIQESIAAERAWRNSCKPNWITTNKIMVYALPIIKEMIPYTYRKLKLVQSLRCGRMP